MIAQVDNYNHPIVQSFVVPNDPEGDFPKDGLTSDDYAGDPNIRVVTWLHLVPHGNDFEKQANPGVSYIAYTYDHTGAIGVKDLPPGAYNFLWFDPVTGKQVTQPGVPVSTGDNIWPKPESFGREVALYIRRQARSSPRAD